MKDNKKDLEIVGSGGKSGSRPPREAPNTLQSRSTIRLVEVISEGEIKGVVGGLKGVFFDDTPVRNTDNSYNFPAVLYEAREGTDPQDYMPGFTAVESAFSVNVELDTTGTTRSTSGSGVDAVRVIVKLPQGLTQLNTSNGDLNGYRVGIAIDTRPSGGGAFTQVFTKTITGKTTSAYQEAYRIEAPTGVAGTWDVRVRRTNTASGTSDIQDKVFWDSRIELIDIKVGYEDAAVVGLAVDSESTGGTIPRRSYLTDGIICQVPTNYTPTVYNDSGTALSWASYSGVWDGLFQYEWTDDPAWILYDLLTNTRYGLGEFIDASTIDIYSFYDASLYNIELVSQTQGSKTVSEPRFRWNGVIQAREDAYKTIQAVAGTMRAMVFSGPGMIKLIQDRPTAASALINNSNVIDGKFNYAGTELSSRITSADVTFNDQYDRYLPRTINITADPGYISAYGFNKIEVSSIGIVSEGQAKRLAKWAIDTSLNCYDTVNFSVSWNNAFIEIGDVVNIADNFYAATTFSGTIKGGTTTSIILDRPVTITVGATIKYVKPNGVEVTRSITNSSGTYSTLTLTAGEDVGLYIGSPWGTYGSVEPRPFKITGVTESEPGVYSLSGTFYDASKYARVEEGIVTNPPIFTAIGGYGIAAPGTVTVTQETFIDPHGVVSNKLRFTWPVVSDPLLRGYKVRYRKDSAAYQWSPELSQNEFVLENAQPGYYEYHVYAYNNRGIQSPASSGYYELIVSVGSSPLNAPSGLELAPSGGTAFTGSAFTFRWTPPATSLLATLNDYEVSFLDASNNVKYTLFTTDTTFPVTNTDIRAWYGSFTRSIKVRVRARDTLLRFSSAVTTTFTNAAVAALTGLSTVPFFNYYQVSHNAPAEGDYRGVLIHHSTVSGFTPSNANQIKNDVGTVHLVEGAPGTTYYVKIGAYDTWGVDELIYSSEVSVTTASTNVGLVPTAPTGLTVTSTVTLQPTGSNTARINITWNGVTGMDAYDLEIIEKQGLTATGTSYPTVNGSGSGTQSYFHESGVPGRSYSVRVRGRAVSAVSAWSTVVTHTAGGDTTAPANASSASVTAGYRTNIISWTSPTDSDLAGIQVYTSATGSGGPWTYLATQPTNTTTNFTKYVHTGLAIGQTVYYQLRSIDTSGNVSAGVYAGTGTTTNVGTDTITALEIAAATITAAEIQANSITADRLVANSITAGQIAAGTITAVQIAAGTITGTQISANSINADRLIAGTITATQLATTTLITLSAQIGSAVIQTANIANATITSAKFAGTIASDNFVAGTSGWQIRRDTGAAEFGDLTARGDFNAGASGTGRRLLITTSDANYLMWAGTGTLSDANAVFYLKKDGSAYFGGTLIAGTINTSANATTTGSGVTGTQTLIVGPYNALANANTKIYATFSYTGQHAASTPTGSSCNTQSFTDTWSFILERSFNGSSWSSLGTAVETSPVSFLWDSELGECQSYSDFGKTYTVSDTDATPGPRYYRWRLTAGTYYHIGAQRIQQTLACQVVQGT